VKRRLNKVEVKWSGKDGDLRIKGKDIIRNIMKGKKWLRRERMN